MLHGPRLSRLRPKHFTALALLALSLVIMTISTETIEPMGLDFGLSLVGGLQSGVAAVGSFVGGLFKTVGEVKQLRRNYDDLVLRMERYAALERSLADLRLENERLKDQLGFSGNIGYRSIPARIIAKDPEGRYFTLTIDKGENQGVARNMPVIAFQNGVEGVVGKIIAVGARTSMVIPVNDNRFSAAARIATTRNEGLVTGTGSEFDPLLLKYIPRTAASAIQFGDLVVTSGYESVFPPDLAIGRVRKISTPDYLTSAEIELDRVLDFSRIEYVFVVDLANPVPPTGTGTFPAPGDEKAAEAGKEGS